jgi:hypothetical protein
MVLGFPMTMSLMCLGVVSTGEAFLSSTFSKLKPD